MLILYEFCTIQFIRMNPVFHSYMTPNRELHIVYEKKLFCYFLHTNTKKLVPWSMLWETISNSNSAVVNSSGDSLAWHLKN